MLPRTGAVAAAAMVGCAQCGLKRARAAGAAALSSSPPSSLPWAATGQRSAGFSTAAKKDGKKKGKGGGGGEEGGGDASKNAWYIKMLDTAPGKGTKALPPDVQAKFQAVGRRFNAESQRRHAREMGDLHRKIKLKQEAMAALPTEALKAEAATIDLTPFPPTRRLTTWTPPVPGFEAGKYDLPGAI